MDHEHEKQTPTPVQPANSSDLSPAPGAGVEQRSRKQMQALRRELLKRLAGINYESWSISQDFPMSDALGDPADTQADAALAPLAPLVEQRP